MARIEMRCSSRVHSWTSIIQHVYKRETKIANYADDNNTVDRNRGFTKNTRKRNLADLRLVQNK